MKFRARWYNMDSIVPTDLDDEIIEAENPEEATRKAYSRLNGTTPPAPCVWIEEVND